MLRARDTTYNKTRVQIICSINQICGMFFCVCVTTKKKNYSIEVNESNEKMFCGASFEGVQSKHGYLHFVKQIYIWFRQSRSSGKVKRKISSNSAVFCFF